MTLKIGVCIKPVPDPEHYDQIQIDPETKTLVRKDMPSVINSADKHAIELAMQLKETTGAEVSIFTMAPPLGKEQLVSALAYGADAAYLLSDRKVGGADTLATSHSLCTMIKKVGQFDLIIAGNESEDGATAHVPSQLGELMGIPHMADVINAKLISEDTINVSKEFENGYGNYNIKLPCVLAVKKKINEVRYPTVMNLFAAKKKPLTIFSAADLPELNEKLIGLAGSPTKAGELITPEYSRDSKSIEGNSEEIAEAILELVAKG
jgi:electron transfer flavoprotein beta subunit